MLDVEQAEAAQVLDPGHVGHIADKVDVGVIGSREAVDVDRRANGPPGRAGPLLDDNLGKGAVVLGLLEDDPRLRLGLADQHPRRDFRVAGVLVLVRIERAVEFAAGARGRRLPAEAALRRGVGHGPRGEHTGGAALVGCRLVLEPRHPRRRVIGAGEDDVGVLGVAGAVHVQACLLAQRGRADAEPAEAAHDVLRVGWLGASHKHLAAAVDGAELVPGDPRQEGGGPRRRRAGSDGRVGRVLAGTGIQARYAPVPALLAGDLPQRAVGVLAQERGEDIGLIIEGANWLLPGDPRDGGQAVDQRPAEFQARLACDDGAVAVETAVVAVLRHGSPLAAALVEEPHQHVLEGRPEAPLGKGDKRDGVRQVARQAAHGQRGLPGDDLFIAHRFTGRGGVELEAADQPAPLTRIGQRSPRAQAQDDGEQHGPDNTPLFRVHAHLLVSIQTLTQTLKVTEILRVWSLY